MMFRFGRGAREQPEPVWVDLTPPDILGRFTEAAALWACRIPGGSDDTVMLACDLLVEGYDTPALRDVAALPLSPEWRDSSDVLQRAFDELGLSFFDEDSGAELIVLRSLCRSFVMGNLAERELVRSAFSIFGYDAPASAEQLVALEFAFEGAEEGWGRKVASGLVDRYAREFLASAT